MTTHDTRAAESLISVERDGEMLTGISTGIPANSFTIRQLGSGRRENGWIVRDNQLTEWRSRGLTERSGLIYSIGPQLAGIFLEDALHDERRDRINDLATIASTLRLLDENRITIGRIHTRSMVLLDGGGVLVLPPEIIRAIAEHQDLDGKLATSELFNHPDRDDRANMGFFIATLIYYVLTGHYPFDAQKAEDVHARIRNGKSIEARHRRFTLRRQISKTLSATLDGDAYEPSPAVWAGRIAEWTQTGFDEQLTDEQLATAMAEAESETGRIERQFGRKELVRMNWRRWLIAAAIVVAVGAVPGTIVRNALRPRATAGMTASEVVTAFYTSINTLDHTTMEDAVVDRAGRALIREVTNMFVIDRQRMAVEMRSSLVNAQVWRAEGMPALRDNTAPYGVVNLSIESLPADAGEAAFRATYERWLPNPESTTDGMPSGRPYVVYQFTDELRLRQDRDDWVIYSLVPVAAQELDPDQLPPLNQSP